MTDLYHLNTIPRDDLRDYPSFQKHRPPPIGHESTLNQFSGTNVFHWYHRTLKSPRWFPYGEPMVLDNDLEY